MDSSRNYHAEIMNAFASGDTKQLATLASELASELASVAGELAELRGIRYRSRQQGTERQRRYRDNHPLDVTSRNVTKRHVTSPGFSPLDGSPLINPSPLIPSFPKCASGQKATATATTYPPDFEAWWQIYPPDGRLSKKLAFKQWEARKRQGHTAEVIMAGTERYKAHLAATSRFPKNAATFLGRELYFLEPWPLPVGEYGARNGASPSKQAADDDKARFVRIASEIDKRKSQLDGAEWWAWVQQAAKLKGLTVHRDILLYAEKHLEDTYAET